MYQNAVRPHGFNHQSFYRQPALNLRPIQQVVSTANANEQPFGLVTPTILPINSNQGSTFNHQSNNDHSVRLTLKNHFQPTNEQKQNYYQKIAHANNQQRIGLTHSSSEQSIEQNGKDRVGTNGVNGHRLLSQQSNGRSESRIKTDGSTHTSSPLITSRSAGVVYDYIQKERRAHTLAPMARIVGPSSAPTANMFARVVAPSDAQTMKMMQAQRPTIPNTVANSSTTTTTSSSGNNNNLTKPSIITNNIFNGYEETDTTADDDTYNHDDEDEDDDDDDAPIVVKVRYDPEAGGPPSEDLIRQAVEKQIKGQGRPQKGPDPLVLEFLGNEVQSSSSVVPQRPSQPMFNRSGLPNTNPMQRVPLSKLNPLQQQQQISASPNAQLLERRRQFLQEQQRTQQLFLQQQQQEQRQKQQQFLLQQQKQQQLLQQEKQKQQQLLLQQQQQRQQQLLQQEQQRRKKEAELLQQEKQRRQQILLQQQQQQEKQQLERFLQQQKQKQLQQQQQQLQLQQKQLQQQQEKQQLEQFLQQQKQKQLQQQQQQQQQQQHQQQLKQIQIQQQRYRQQLMQQQQQQQNMIVAKPSLIPNSDQRQQANAYLPPMSPRAPQGTVVARQAPPHRPTIMLVPNTSIISVRPNPRASHSSINSTQYPYITVQPLLPRNHKTGLMTSHSYSGLNSLSSYAPKYIPSMFIPINAGLGNDQSSMSMNGPPPHLLPRPHTAPSSTELYRPSSVLDIPELSQDNLRSMLNEIPGLRGRRFSIEYAEPPQSDGYPIPLDLDESRQKYPDAVIVDQLPKNLIQHVQNSNNAALVAALSPPIPSNSGFPSTNTSKSSGPVLTTPVANGKIYRTAPLNQRVYQTPAPSLDDVDTNTEGSVIPVQTSKNN